MGGLYSKFNRLQLNEKTEGTSGEIKRPTIESSEQKTPCPSKIKYLLDPRSATAGIKRTPIIVMRETVESGKTVDTTPTGPLPYLETDLDVSECTIRTSTPVLSASPMKDIPQSSPVLLHKSISFSNSSNELSISQQEEIFNLNSDEEDGTEQLFNNERMLFESEDQGSFDEDDDKNTLSNFEAYERELICETIKPRFLLTENPCEIDDEIEELFSGHVETTAGNSLEREFSEIEECLFSPISTDDKDVLTFSSNVPHLKVDNHLTKTKNGRTPLGIVSSNPCSPIHPTSLILTNKDKDSTKPWRGLTEERLNRGMLDVENTPPSSNLPPPDITSSAPGKLLLGGKGGSRGNKASWGRDSSLII